MITKKLMERLSPTKGLNSSRFNLVTHRDELIDTMNRILPLYGINNYWRVSAFLGNCGIETDYFRTTEEYASGADYEGRSDLGNIYKGDGRKFKGRDLTQTTGRNNYLRVLIRFVKKLTGRDYSKNLPGALIEADRLGVNFIKNPEKLAEIRFAVESACIFWDEHRLNAYADRGEFRQLSAIVNRGDKNKTPLHWAKRNALYQRCLEVVPKDFSFSKPAAFVDVNSQPDAAVNQTVDSTANPVDTAANPVVLTPTDNSQPNADQPATGDAGAATAAEKSKVKEISDKYLRHCPQDTVKNVLVVIAGRVLAGITTLWTLGLHGQIFLIVAGILLAGCVGYALYNYSGRIFGWIKDVADSMIGQ
ncbi:MAG TPA: hypothetical protein VF692_04810 [Pyrinomonadaceae bacterium]|jgi:hypothetical protein